jgi:hypothetical protein
MRMKPARATTSGEKASIASASCASKASRERSRVVDHRGGDAVRLREAQAGGVGAVADHRRDLRRPPSAAEALTIASMFEPRPRSG